jgi:hypothetical protein
MPFSSSNQITSSVFREPEGAGFSSDRLSGSIWSNTPNQSAHRTQATGQVSEHPGVWGTYGSGATGQLPEYQPSWTYSQPHSLHIREAHSGWNSADHDAWKYSRSQAPPPPAAGVWQYPGAHQEYPDWSSRAQHSAQSQGYYYVASGHHHEQRASEDYIPYDIGARRAYQIPPPPPGYPLPPHMQYYSPGSNPSAMPAPQISSHGEIPPSANPITKPGGAASFLFEAAAAAMSKSTPEDRKPSTEVTGSSIGDAGKDFVPEARDSVSPINRRPEVPNEDKIRGKGGKGSSAFPKVKGVAQAGQGSRVNNHQMRLHATGNEKAPLATGSSSGQITTLMIRNIPNRYTQTELMAELKEAGFEDKFDFFYLPMDHETHANFGYAFINFVDETDVGPFTKKFNGLKLNRFTSNKIIQIVPAQLQGFQANLQHYCKKAVCTDDNIDYRPLFFVDGKCLEFHRASEFSDKAEGSDAPRPTTDAEQTRRDKPHGRGFSKGTRGTSDRPSRS